MLKFVMVSATGLMLPAAGPSWIAGMVWTTVPLRRNHLPSDGCWGGVEGVERRDIMVKESLL